MRPILPAVLVAVALTSPAARADDDDPLRAPRFGLVPGIGVGFTGFTSTPAPFSSFVAESVLQLEFIVDTGRWGGFVRGAYLSSGNSGLWTAPVAAVGGSYRFRGDGETSWGILGRFGAIYQRWHVTTFGCDIPYVLPSSCAGYSAPPIAGTVTSVTPTIDVTADNVGLVAGASIEAPTDSAYITFGAELSATDDVDHSSPGLAFSGQLTISIALRTHVHDTLGSRGAPTHYFVR